jgi:hypothetical protein
MNIRMMVNSVRENEDHMCLMTNHYYDFSEKQVQLGMHALNMPFRFERSVCWAKKPNLEIHIQNSKFTLNKKLLKLSYTFGDKKTTRNYVKSKVFGLLNDGSAKFIGITPFSNKKYFPVYKK